MKFSYYADAQLYAFVTNANVRTADNLQYLVFALPAKGTVLIVKTTLHCAPLQQPPYVYVAQVNLDRRRLGVIDGYYKMADEQ